jgi:hypothetical protein
MRIMRIMRIRDVGLTVAAVLILAACGSGFDRKDLAKQVTAALAAHGVALHEVSGTLGEGPVIVLDGGRTGPFGGFSLYVADKASLFDVEDQTADAPGADGIRWEDRSQSGRPFFIAYKRYGDHLEVAWETTARSTADARFRALDRLLATSAK